MNRTFLISVKPNKRNPENKRSGSPNKILMLFGMSLTVCLLFTLRFDDLESRRRLKLEEDTKPEDTIQASTSQAEASKPDGINLDEWADDYFGKVKYKYTLTRADMHPDNWHNWSFTRGDVTRTIVPTDGLKFEELHEGREVDIESNWADAMEDILVATENGVNRGFWNTNEWDSTSGTFEIIGMLMMLSACGFAFCHAFYAVKGEDGFSKRLCYYLCGGSDALDAINESLRKTREGRQNIAEEALKALVLEPAAAQEQPAMALFRSNTGRSHTGGMDLDALER